MKALSTRQPWAWLLAHAYKPVENRTWVTHYRGPVLLHASQQMTRADYDACLLFIRGDERIRHLCDRVPQPADLERGGIVGRANLVACQRQHWSAFFTGPFGFVMADVKPLPFVPHKGALGLFDVPGVWP